MLIDYKNVTVTHDDGETILNGIDFKVDAGEFVYIIGKVGSGKSTLLRSLYADTIIDDAFKAKVFDYDLQKIRNKDVQNLRRQLGIIFQDFKLLTDRSVKQNLEFVLQATGWKKKEEREQRITEVLESVKMQDKQDKMPHELSGGEQQRIAIARAMLNSPKIILADEPTGNLDPETAESIMGLFRDIADAGTAVVITTHNLPMLNKFHGVVYQCEDSNLTDITQEYNSAE